MSSAEEMCKTLPEQVDENPAPDFNEDVSLLARHPENYGELLIKTQLQNGLADAGIQQLDGVQGVLLRHCLKRHDIFGMLPAKSGKTAIFVLATLQMLSLEPREASYR
ncbi:hypothetical protein RvY_14217 [Ramazzottius varieornatus]|uniref:DEAD/DEAH box helicase domain-containing protein n=1 Tax=Ramazzottius varieornatus TaxID=947166 RepID=A0A1D1VQK1_RAMVA|nr:hypothetical protein RvY_14217 [Ramazzottius varieornatus]